MSNCKTSLTDIGNIERDPVFLSQKGKPGGVATLDANGKVPLSQIDIVAMFTERDPVYRADRGAPFGVPTLDGFSLILTSQLGTGPTDNTRFLRADRTWAVPAGGGGGNIPEGWLLTGTDVSLATSTSKVVVGALPTIAKFGVVGDTPADITALIRGAASQSADILEIQNSASAVLFSIDPTGKVTIGGNSPIAKFSVKGSVITDVTAIVKAVASQTADVLELQDSTGAVLLSVDPTGVATGSIFRLLGTTSTSYLEMADGSSDAVSPSNRGRQRYNNTTGNKGFDVSVDGGPWERIIADEREVERIAAMLDL